MCLRSHPSASMSIISKMLNRNSRYYAIFTLSLHFTVHFTSIIHLPLLFDSVSSLPPVTVRPFLSFHLTCEYLWTGFTLFYLISSFLSASFRSFLFSKEGNPNKRNVHNETCLHVLCQGPQILLLPEGALSPRLARPQRDEQRRADCLQVQTHGGGANID